MTLVDVHFHFGTDGLYVETEVLGSEVHVDADRTAVVLRVPQLADDFAYGTTDPPPALFDVLRRNDEVLVAAVAMLRARCASRSPCRRARWMEALTIQSWMRPGRDWDVRPTSHESLLGGTSIMSAPEADRSGSAVAALLPASLG